VYRCSSGPLSQLENRGIFEFNELPLRPLLAVKGFDEILEHDPGLIPEAICGILPYGHVQWRRRSPFGNSGIGRPMDLSPDHIIVSVTDLNAFTCLREFLPGGCRISLNEITKDFLL
jgi:hypothetical protein